MSADVAIVIVTYNSAHVVGALLDSIPVALDQLSAEVVVVDNGSQDDTVRLLEARGDCQVIRSTNLGYAAGFNLGVRAAPEPAAVLILNPDTRLMPKSIPWLLDSLAIPGTGIAVPRVNSADGQLTLSLRREPTLLRAIGLTATKAALFSEYLAQEEDYAQPRQVDWALGAVMLVSRQCLEKVGEWDESFFLYSEETDFCLRARDLGYLTRYTPLAVAEHIGAQSGTSDKIHTMQIVNRVRLYRRRHGGVSAWAFFGATLLSELSWVVRGNKQSWAAIKALLVPRLRPAELNSSQHYLPD